MSYITSNVLSSGDYGSEVTFYSLANVPDYDRGRYRDYMAGVRAGGRRYAVITRSTTVDDPDDGTGTDDETTVIVNPSPQWLADMFRQIPAVDSHAVSSNGKRYYTAPGEYYEACVRNRVASQRAVTESYCVDIMGLSPTRLAVIEAAGGVRPHGEGE